jgi:hypothetical protein
MLVFSRRACRAFGQPRWPRHAAPGPRAAAALARANSARPPPGLACGPSIGFPFMWRPGLRCWPGPANTDRGEAAAAGARQPARRQAAGRWRPAQLESLLAAKGPAALQPLHRPGCSAACRSGAWPPPRKTRQRQMHHLCRTVHHRNVPSACLTIRTAPYSTARPAGRAALSCAAAGTPRALPGPRGTCSTACGARVPRGAGDSLAMDERSMRAGCTWWHAARRSGGGAPHPPPLRGAACNAGGGECRCAKQARRAGPRPQACIGPSPGVALHQSHRR